MQFGDWSSDVCSSDLSQMGFFDKIKRAFTGEEKTEEVEVQEKYDKGLEKTRKTFGERKIGRASCRERV